MMKTTFFLLTMILWGAFSIRAQDQPQLQTVKSLAIEMHDYAWYQQQYKLWGDEVKRHKKNQEAWINYYAAARMARFMAEEKKEQQAWYEKEAEVIAKMDKAIKGTFAYYRVMTWYHAIWSAKTKEEQDQFIGYALKAHELEPDNPAVYPNLMNIYEMYRPDKKKQKEIAQLWKAAGTLTPNLMALSYNALMNTKKNAILITGGDNDTYSAWIAQHADDFRKDVNVWNIYLISNYAYRNRLFEEMEIPLMERKHYEVSEILQHIIKHKGTRDLYFFSKGIIAKDTTIFDKLYNVGVIYKYAEEPFNNSALIVDHFENKFITDHLKYDYYQSAYPAMDANRNSYYLPGLVSLYQYYELIGDEEKAENTKALILRLGKDFPNLADIKSEIGLD